MAVRIRKGKKTAKGVSLYLDIYFKGKRWYEFLNLYLKGEAQGETMKAAKLIKKKTERDLIMGRYGVTTGKDSEDFTTLHTKYKRLEHYRVYRACTNALIKFNDSPTIPCNEITEDFCKRFRSHLEKTYKGETPHNYFKVFKRMLKDATRAGYFIASPAEYIVNKNPTGRDVKKDVLFTAEIQKLYEAHCGNLQVRRAFLFALNTGLRLVDIRLLTWENINLQDKVLKFSQSKTTRQNIIPLNDNAIEILKKIVSDTTLFNLPSTNAVNKSIDTWKTNAGITKKVTFHVARHSAISNWLLNSGNLKLAGTLAGHASIRETEKYSHIADEQKRNTVNKMPVYKKK